MSKTSQMLDIERTHGKAIEHLIADKLNELGEVNLVAADLQVSRQTLWNWMFRLGIRLKTVAELPPTATVAS